MFEQICISIDMFNSIQRKKEQVSLYIWLTYSDLVFILSFLCCYLIWAPQRARTSSHLLVLQMEPFYHTCWLTFHPKLTEQFSLQTNVPERIMEWSVSSRRFWTKLKVVCSWIYWFPFVFASSYNLPYASLPVIQQKFILLLLARLLGIEYETLQENRYLLLDLFMHSF